MRGMDINLKTYFASCVHVIVTASNLEAICRQKHVSIATLYLGPKRYGFVSEEELQRFKALEMGEIKLRKMQWRDPVSSKTDDFHV